MASHLKRTLFGGFTLIELAVVLVIVSLMTGFGMKAMQSNRANESNCYEQTRVQMRTISAALDAYQRRTGVYPRPAAINASPTGNTFGVQDGSSGTNITAAASNTVWIGALPFSTLGLNASYAADCWGNKFTYTVTQALSGTTSAYSAGTGAITVRTGTIASPTSLSTIGAYAVVSRGESALTTCARNFTGSSSSCYCNSSQSNATITRIDKENCDTNNAVVYAAAFNNGQNATDFYDDIVIYKDKAATSSTNCVAQDVTWSTNCSGPVGALVSGSSTTITNTKSGYTGSATGTCSNGTVSTSSTSCTATSSDCTAPWGATVTNGNSVTAYLSATPAGPCTSQTRTCTSGTLSGTYTAQTCTAGCASGSQTWLTNCTASATATTAGGTRALTNTASGYSGSATATCNAGGAGTWALSSTSCTATASCTLPWGGTISHGASVTAYLYTSSTDCSESETRTCTNGTLSGSYTEQSCTPSGGGGGCSLSPDCGGGYCCGGYCLNEFSTPCTGTAYCTIWGSNVMHGASVTAYLSATPSGACTSQTRTCNDGSLSGSYTAQTCTAGCSTASQTWLTNCTASATATTAGATRALTNTAANYTGAATATCNAGGAGTWALSSTSCTASVNGSCGTSHGSSTTSAPSTNLCAAGTAGSVSGTGPYTWNCTGSGGGTTASCSSNRSCTGTPWGTVAHGYSNTAFASASPAGACSGQTRTCSQGTMSGTNTITSCTAGCATTTQTWNTNCTASATATTAGGTRALTNTAGGYTGSATATCNAGGSGAWVLSGTSCAASGCDNDSSDGLGSGQKYCTGVSYEIGSVYVDSCTWGYFSAVNCNQATLCQSGTASAAIINSERDGCPEVPVPAAGGGPGGTCAIAALCQDTFQCTCG